jgi:hypothetical protein
MSATSKSVSTKPIIDKLIVTGICINDFKSFGGQSKIRLDRHPLLLVIGPNNSGKSNFLLAINLWVKLFQYVLVNNASAWENKPFKLHEDTFRDWHPAALESPMFYDGKSSCMISITFRCSGNHEHTYSFTITETKEPNYYNIDPCCHIENTTCDLHPKCTIGLLTMSSDLYFKPPGLVWTTTEQKEEGKKEARIGVLDLLNLLHQLKQCDTGYFAILYDSLKSLFPGFEFFNIAIDGSRTQFAASDVCFQGKLRKLANQGSGFKKVTSLITMLLLEHAQYSQQREVQIEGVQIQRRKFKKAELNA